MPKAKVSQNSINQRKIFLNDKQKTIHRLKKSLLKIEILMNVLHFIAHKIKNIDKINETIHDTAILTQSS